MNSSNIITRVKDAILILERIQKDNNELQHVLERSIQKIISHNEEIKTMQNELSSILVLLNNIDIATVNQPVQDNESTNESKQTEPMTVRDAIRFLRNSNIYLSDYGYHLSSSFETRYRALKEAMIEYPMSSVLKKLRALIIVWSQNTLNHINSAEKYLNNLRVDFHTLQEESIKPKCS